MLFLKFAVLLHCHEMKFTMINIHFISETVLHSYMDPQAILMLCDRMILLFLEGGIEDKMELKSKKIIFFLPIPPHSQLFITEMNFLNNVYEETHQGRDL